MPAQFDGGKNRLFNKSARTPGYPDAKEWGWTLTSHYVQKLIQSGSNKYQSVITKTTKLLEKKIQGQIFMTLDLAMVS